MYRASDGNKAEPGTGDMPEQSRSAVRVGNYGGCLVVALLFVLTASGAAAGSSVGFEDRCTRLGTEAKVSVTFEDKPVARIDNRSRSELKGLSGARSNQYHSILGLTHAVPSANLKLTPNMLVDANGAVCVVPSLVLTLGFSEFEVYLAKELKDPCHRRIVEEHENEHAAVWRNHWRAGARLLETALRNTLAKPIYSSDQNAAVNEMTRRVNDAVGPLLRQLKDGVTAANQQIDTPASYQFEDNRMRACP